MGMDLHRASLELDGAYAVQQPGLGRPELDLLYDRIGLTVLADGAFRCSSSRRTCRAGVEESPGVQPGYGDLESPRSCRPTLRADPRPGLCPVSYTHLRAHETDSYL